MQERLQSKTAAHTLPSWRARAICVLLLCFSPSLLTCLTLQRINRVTTVVACLPNFAAYINDDGQGETVAFVTLGIMLTGSAPKGKFERLASDSHFRTVQTCSGQTAKICRLNVRLHIIIHTDTAASPYSSLGGARSGSPQQCTPQPLMAIHPVGLWGYVLSNRHPHICARVLLVCTARTLSTFSRRQGYQHTCGTCACIYMSAYDCVAGDSVCSWSPPSSATNPMYANGPCGANDCSQNREHISSHLPCD